MHLLGIVRETLLSQVGIAGIPNYLCQFNASHDGDNVGFIVGRVFLAAYFVDQEDRHMPLATVGDVSSSEKNDELWRNRIRDHGIRQVLET